MRRLVAIALLAALAGHAGAAQAPPPAAERLEQVREEARLAERQARALDQQADRARDRARKLATRRLAIAAEIEAGEARLAAAAIEAERLTAAIAEVKARIARERAPAAALLAGLATMARQPPILTIADRGSLDDLVRTQALIDTTLPLIETRTAAIRERAARLDIYAAALEERRGVILSERDRLDEARRRFAAIEAEQRAEAGELGIAAARADTRAIAARERTDEVAAAADREAFAADFRDALATYPPAPRRPTRLRGDIEPSLDPPPFAYALPLDGQVTAGLGSLTGDGVRARGMTVAARRGARIDAPASGRIVFAGAFRTNDGVFVIDHGDDWLSLLTGVAADVEQGNRVRAGQAIGRALGPVGVELWQGQRPRSPALMAALGDTGR